MKKNRYFEFLCDLVGGTNHHGVLLQQLHGIEFYSLVPNDDNREADGEQLRNNFLDEVGPQGSSSLPGTPCSVFEMLIGLAYRLEFELLGGRFERPMRDWFWVLIDNLGLIRFEDDTYTDPKTAQEVSYIVKKMLDREYEPNGEGGLFPLNTDVSRCDKSVTKVRQNCSNVTKLDQRCVEIWYQMSAWVIENYPI